MPKFDDPSRSLVARDQDSTLIAVIEMSQKQWLVGAVVPGLAREPQKKLAPAAPALLALLERWRSEAAKAGGRIERICVAYEAGRDGFWLARWLRARGIECHGPAAYQRQVRTLRQVYGLGWATADMLSTELFARALRDRRAVARSAGLTGAPDESGQRRREKGLARAGNARVRHGMIQFAWRFLRHQPHSALAQWFRQRTQDGRRTTRKTMIVALARKLLVALWRLATSGAVPQGVRLQATI